MIVPTREPQNITAGETLTWTRTLADYSPADGWALNYFYRSRNGVGFDAVAVAAASDDYLVEVPSSATASLAPGTICWQAWVSRGSERYLVGSGETKVAHGFVGGTATTTVDARSTAERILDAIDATLEGRVTKDISQYMIGNRQLIKISPNDLLALRKHYADLVAKERRRRRAKAGQPWLKNINVRFDNP